MYQVRKSTHSAEVSHWLLFYILHTLPEQEDQIKDLLYKYELNPEEPTRWYNLNAILMVLRELYAQCGPDVLFSLGKEVPKRWFKNTDHLSLEDGLERLNEFYQDQHRGGDIGYYRLIYFNQDRKEAKVECHNPYPCYWDRGILTGLTRLCRGGQGFSFHIELDAYRPSRLHGSDSSFYNIMWL